MKIRPLALLAAGLIALGAIGDHVLLNTSSNHPAAVSNKAPTSPAPATTGASGSGNGTSATVADAGTNSIDLATERAYAIASPSVVFVNSVGTGTGSGVIYDTNGDIITNYHVVNGATSLKVTLSDGRTFTAHLVGTDPVDDLAVIRIHASGLQPARFAQAGTFHVAQTVLAIGSPLGLKASVTSGLISGLGRVEQEPNGAYLPNAIQTSAPINPGNSGGALVALNGVVVGMPTLVQTNSGNGTATQNIGFAVPSTRITALASQIISGGKVLHTGRAYLGISPVDPTNQSSSPFGFGPSDGGGQIVSGAVVQQLAASGPAAKAGIQQGATITSVNGTSISTAQDLLTILAQHKPGDTLSIKVDRGGSAVSMQVHLGE